MSSRFRMYAKRTFQRYLSDVCSQQMIRSFKTSGFNSLSLINGKCDINGGKHGTVFVLKTDRDVTIHSALDSIRFDSRF